MTCLPAIPLGAQQRDGLPTEPATGGAWRPRVLADGQPDIQGRWRAEEGGTYDTTAVESGGGIFQRLVDTAAGRPVAPRPSRVIDPADGQIPYLPWARAHQQEIQRNADNPRKREHIDPRARCLPGGVPREAFPTGFRFLQVPGAVVFLGNQKSVSRIIPLDDRPFLDDRIKLWMGDSRGHWEGNSLVVEVRNQNGKGRFDMVGNFASDAVRVFERWTVVSERVIEYRATIEDPDVYTRPWTLFSRILKVAPSHEPYGDELWEDACHEGERSAEHMILSSDAAAAGPKPR
ncbi:MAG: hypothetical protein GEU82_18160 [Luteitalea sp.]|nr:hypothetical protein [Luteitalea sp.]